MKMQLIIGTRGSKLALWQAGYIAGALQRIRPELDIKIRKITTTGDKIIDKPLAKIGGKGLFTQEIDREMLAGEIDIAVHSLKDMPAEMPDGLVIAAVTARREPGDAFVSNIYSQLADLPAGAVIGTSSLRRGAQLLAWRPDLVIKSLRGNVDTRLRKLATDGYDGIVLAAAGLKRLGLAGRINEIISPAIMLPAVGQGALAVQARADDAETRQLLAAVDDASTRSAVTAERAFLRVVGGSCQVPFGVYGQVAGERLDLEAAIISLDGREQVRHRLLGCCSEPVELGEQLAEAMLAAGGREIMAEVLKGEADG